MRGVVILVLVLNLLLLSWHWLREPLMPAVAPVLPERPDTPSLFLLSESPAGGVWGGSVANVAGSCREVGGFERLESARALEHLLGDSVDRQMLVRDRQVGDWYWVYLPPLPSPQEALRYQEELRAAGLESQLIAEGALANAVVLGLFGRRADADAVLIRLRALKLAGEIREIPRLRQEYWLRLPEGSHALERLRATSEFSELKHRVSACSGVAIEK